MPQLLNAGTFSNLCFKVHGDEAAQNLFDAMIRREQAMCEATKQYGVDINVERAKHDMLLVDRRSSVSCSRRYLQGTRMQTTSGVKLSQRIASSGLRCQTRVFDQALSLHESRICRVDELSDIENTAHIETMCHLNAQCSRLARCTCEWQSRYENDSGALASYYQVRSQERTGNAQRLDLLKQRRYDEQQHVQDHASACARQDTSDSRVSNVHEEHARAEVIQHAIREYRTREASVH